MIHQFRDKKQIRDTKKTTRSIVAIGVFIFVSSIGVWTWFGSPVNKLGNPVWGLGSFIADKIYGLNYFFRSKSALTTENHNLIDEITFLRLRMSDYGIIEKENQDLKEILGRVGEKNDFILGNILSKPNRSPYDTLIIDIGKSNGVKEGNQVYASGVIPIGNVEKVYDDSSLVSLYTNPGRKTEGFINISNVSVELTGRGGGNFEMVIPMELEVEKDAIIYLPGDNSKIIAHVDEVISSPIDPFKKVILSSPINIQNLKWVEVKK